MKNPADKQFLLVDTWNGGTEVAVPRCEGTEFECMKWVHKHHCFSFHNALTEQGFELVPVED